VGTIGNQALGKRSYRYNPRRGTICEKKADNNGKNNWPICMEGNTVERGAAQNKKRGVPRDKKSPERNKGRTNLKRRTKVNVVQSQRGKPTSSMVKDISKSGRQKTEIELTEPVTKPKLSRPLTATREIRGRGRRGKRSDRQEETTLAEE